MLRFTSLLFATVSWHASTLGRATATYQILYLVIAILSVARYTTNSAFIQAVDRIMAHAGFLFIIVSETPKLIAAEKLWLLTFPTAVLMLWCSEFQHPSVATRIHVALHVVSVMGLHAYLVELYKP